MRCATPLLALAAAVSTPAMSANGDVTLLFVDDDPLEITINGPVNSIVRSAKRSTRPYPATLAANGENHAIKLSARGKTRRNRAVCQFPPMRVKFAKKPDGTSLFNKQGKIKLVTHCRNSRSFDRYVLREFTAYRLYNVLTPASLKVRLLRVHYLDDDNEIADRWGFFIEDIGDAARRIGGKEIDVERVSSSALDPDQAARYALFQYMIGNLDWSMKSGPKGSDCCHNSKLVGNTSRARDALIPIPYDFDYSGLVSAPYAVPPTQIPISSVRQRYYRGLCQHNLSVQRVALEFLAARPALEAEIREIAQLDDKDRDLMLRYLAGFFRDIATPRQVDRNVLKTCR